MQRRAIGSQARWLLVVAVAVLSLIISVWPQTNAAPTSEQRVSSLAKQIRCPACAGLSVEQSDIAIAQSSREEIRTQVSLGQSDQQIKAYFVERYGSTALMSPPRNGINAIVWLAPAIGLVLAIVGMAFVFRRWRSARSSAAELPTVVERTLVDAALKDLR